MKQASHPPVQNWFGDLISHPTVVTHAESVNDLVAIVKDPDTYPSPVRAVGSNHSATACGVADGGTVVVMRGMNRVLHVGDDTVTAEAGALYIDVAQELRRHDRQFYVNVELGNLTIGSGACCGTKDSSLPGELGQVCSYAVAIKLVTPAGELLEVTEDQPELLQVMRSSYGLLGIIYEVTFKVRPLEPLAVRHVTYSLAQFEERFPAILARPAALMFYMFPFDDAITLEFRRYHPRGRASNRWPWRLRNLGWRTLGPAFSYFVRRSIPIKSVRYFVIDCANRVLRFLLSRVRSNHTFAPDQMIRYPERSGLSRYTFSISAFPAETFVRVLRSYYAFCHEYYRTHGYRCDMLNVGYRVAKDTSSLFSYSFDGTVMTLDPVSTGGPGWIEFLTAFNAFCSEHGGVPLFNQTPGLTRPQTEKAFGERRRRFCEYQRRFDPTNRLLNPYFRELLSEE